MRRRRLPLPGALIAGAVLVATAAAAQSPWSPFSDFEDVATTNLAVKLSYPGVQREPISTVVIVEAGVAPSLERFVPYRHADVSYLNDDATKADGEPAIMVVEAAIADIRAVIAAVGDVSEATDSAATPETLMLSYMMVGERDGAEIGFDALLDGPAAWKVLTAIESALRGEPFAAGVAASMRLAVCGDRDQDGDGVENRCDRCVEAGLPENDGCPTCPGDCRGDREVTVDEILLAVNIALGLADIDQCLAADTSGDRRVTVEELLQAVNAALDGCGAAAAAQEAPSALAAALKPRP